MCGLGRLSAARDRLRASGLITSEELRAGKQTCLAKGRLQTALGTGVEERRQWPRRTKSSPPAIILDARKHLKLSGTIHHFVGATLAAGFPFLFRPTRARRACLAFSSQELVFARTRISRCYVGCSSSIRLKLCKILSSGRVQERDVFFLSR